MNIDIAIEKLKEKDDLAFISIWFKPSIRISTGSSIVVILISGLFK